MTIKQEDLLHLSPREIRDLIRKGLWDRPTAGVAPGHAQANLVILPREYAFEFLLFCQRNPKPCPVLEVLEAGQWQSALLAPGADVRSDVPLYHVYRKGKLTRRVKDVTGIWNDDLVTFFLGCSFSFEEALLGARIPVRHIEEGKNVPMYVTGLQCKPAGRFRGPLVVTMRPIPRELVTRAVQVTSRYGAVHGGPVHIGEGDRIGIQDLGRPDWGEPVTVLPGETPMFWACGVTPQAVVMEAKPSFCITHAPGHMFISDILNEELASA